MGSFFGKITVETPEYEILTRHDEANLEIRSYGPRYEAYVTSSDFPEAESEAKFTTLAFTTLAKYIGVMSKPQNKDQETQMPESIPMTAPVVMSCSSHEDAKFSPTAMPLLKGSNAGEESMAFILPHKFIVDSHDPPEPQDKRVHVRKISGEVVAVQTFSGAASPEQSAQRASDVVDIVDQIFHTKFEVERNESGDPLWSFRGYNAPFVIPCFRTNEVAIQVKSKSG
mmetsp:Transcript_20368/g.40037  ORF Transcript_20368/g.40037 Transcript_20368/m.40037 type:complete len:227 (+) Transcript_20368:220-900(+)